MAEVLGGRIQAVHHIDGLALVVEPGRVEIAHGRQLPHAREQVLNLGIQGTALVGGAVEFQQALRRNAVGQIGKDGARTLQHRVADAHGHLIIKNPENGDRRGQDGQGDAQQDFSFHAGQRRTDGIRVHVSGPGCLSGWEGRRMRTASA